MSDIEARVVAKVWLKCLDCGHVWDDENPEHEVCDCFDRRGHRRVRLVSAFATNAESRWP